MKGAGRGRDHSLFAFSSRGELAERVDALPQSAVEFIGTHRHEATRHGFVGCSSTAWTGRSKMSRSFRPPLEPIDLRSYIGPTVLVE